MLGKSSLLKSTAAFSGVGRYDVSICQCNDNPSRYTRSRSSQIMRGTICGLRRYCSRCKLSLLCNNSNHYEILTWKRFRISGYDDHDAEGSSGSNHSKSRDESIWFTLHCYPVLYGCRSSMIVPKTVFMPQPNVESAVIRLTRKATPPAEVIDEDFLFEVSRGSFVQRRKTILNNLQSSLPDGKRKKRKF